MKATSCSTGLLPCAAGTVSFSTNLYNFGEEDNNLIYATWYLTT